MQQDLTFRGYLLLCRRAPGGWARIVAVMFVFVGAVLRHGLENALLFGGATVVVGVLIAYPLSRWWIRRRGLLAYAHGDETRALQLSRPRFSCRATGRVCSVPRCDRPRPVRPACPVGHDWDRYAECLGERCKSRLDRT